MPYSESILSRICIPSFPSMLPGISKNQLPTVQYSVGGKHLRDSFAWKYLVNFEKSSETRV